MAQEQVQMHWQRRSDVEAVTSLLNALHLEKYFHEKFQELIIRRTCLNDCLMRTALNNVTIEKKGRE